MGRSQYLVVIILLSSTLIASYALPRQQYEGTDYIAKLNVPYIIEDWKGRDVTDQINLDFEKNSYKFISKTLAHQYINDKGNNLLFIILDAGNFHNPLVCYTQAGFKAEELNYSEFHIANQTIKAHTLFSQKGPNGFFSFYWIIIDKDIASEWIEQKIKQLYFSLFNKKRVGLMIRVDIPSERDDFENAKHVADRFLKDLYNNLDKEDTYFIFGENNEMAENRDAVHSPKI